MVNLLIFILVCYGASNIVIFGSIFKGFRDFWDKVNANFFGKLFSCFICLPTYWGFILSLLGLSPMESTHLINDLSIFGLFTISTKFICIFFDGCLASGTSWLVHTFQEMCERAFVKD